MSEAAEIENKPAAAPAVSDFDACASVEEFMQKVFRKDAAKENCPVATSASGSPSETSLELASDTVGSLIERAAKTIEFLSARCEILDTELKQARDQIKEQTTMSESLATIATKLRDRAESLDRDLTSALTRCETAEARIVSLEQYQKTTTARAKRAEGISDQLQRQVEAAFGAASPISSIMNAAVLQQAAE